MASGVLEFGGVMVIYCAWNSSDSGWRFCVFFFLVVSLRVLVFEVAGKEIEINEIVNGSGEFGGSGY